MLLQSAGSTSAAILAVLFVVYPYDTESVSVFPSCVLNCTNVELPGSYADCGSCYRFFICVGGRTTVITCPGHLYYDHIIGVCSHYKSSHCGSSEENITRDGVQDTPRENKTSTSLTSPDLDSQTPPTSCITTCSDVTLSGRYADCTSCSHMIVCIGGRMTKVKCPQPLHYDPLVGVCNYHWEVNCKKTQAVVVNASLRAVTTHAIRIHGTCIKECAEVTAPGKHASCRSCSEFVLCTGKKTFALNCPKKLQFDLVSKRCTFAKSVDCREEAGGRFEPGDSATTTVKTAPQSSLPPAIDKPSSGNALDGSMQKQMGELLNLVPDISQESQTGKQKTEDFNSMANLGHMESSSSHLRNDNSDTLSSLRKLFCETFSSDFKLHLFLCEK